MIYGAGLRKVNMKMVKLISSKILKFIFVYIPMFIGYYMLGILFNVLYKIYG